MTTEIEDNLFYIMATPTSYQAAQANPGPIPTVPHPLHYIGSPQPTIVEATLEIVRRYEERWGNGQWIRLKNESDAASYQIGERTHEMNRGDELLFVAHRLVDGTINFTVP